MDGASTARPRPGQEHPGEGDVLELAQVAEVVLDGEASLTRPAERLTQPPCATHTRARSAETGRTFGGEVTHVQALRLVEQVERAAQIPFGLPYPRHRDAPAIPVLRQAGVLAQFLARQQVLHGGIKLVALKWIRLMPTCMSAAPLSAGAPARSRAASPRS